MITSLEMSFQRNKFTRDLFKHETCFDNLNIIFYSFKLKNIFQCFIIFSNYNTIIRYYEFFQTLKTTDWIVNIICNSYKFIHRLLLFTLNFFFSLLSGCSDGSIYIHDVYNLTGQIQYTAKCICKVIKQNNYSHKHSVECVSWYGDDNALFITSGSDKTLKIWDTQNLKSIESYCLKGKIFQHDCSSFPSSNPIIAGNYLFIYLIFHFNV